MRIFLDANNLFSAAKTDGAMRGFIATLRDSGHILVLDAYVLDEARRNLEAKFPAALEPFEVILSKLEIAAKVAGPLREDIAPALPWKDRPVLAAAIHLRCQVLLSAVTMQLSPAALMVVGISSLRNPYVGGNGMNPTRLGIRASDRANAPRLCLPLRACPS
jgi:hypothetical protein